MTSLPAIHTASVIGAGAWGTTLARHLVNQGLTIKLWAYENEVVESINLKRENALFLPDVTLPTALSATHSLQDAVAATGLIVLAVPSHVMRAVVRQLIPFLSEPLPIVVASKGIEEDSHQLMSQVLDELLPSGWANGITVLTGPSFAAEVSQDKPTTILLAGQDAGLTAHLQMVFISAAFRVYTGTDMIGAQLGGALKNVMAIAAGVVDGLELGLNARAALITRGLAEVIRLGVALGADVHTFYGLSGLGDLVLTCTGALSRNHAVGLQLGQGRRLEDILHETVTVAEGVRTTKAAMALARQFQVEMPIVQGVHAMLFEDKPPRQIVADLMSRSAKEEISFANSGRSR
ncbi:MAG: NAD(P)-dependent glycerol-3-phosphate dehydrogenase [Nitrospira sp. SB0667_bin_9]|nr:NAD(P)-dependent glycerol-3-phosphate dehydrogenase [Nitrospira sp. SB0667_bin_9]MYD30767.1 NAD(P)-dependent glycerol-3-phosphate dehydrogenase [Nitrospira sp. SB0661_bin_20]MYJ23156.1 NAD(P)-dependent glycerol-3-phosphate dehydrogenase [Nitrospira sp. SB0673_bin_12]